MHLLIGWIAGGPPALPLLRPPMQALEKWKADESSTMGRPPARIAFSRDSNRENVERLEVCQLQKAKLQKIK